MPRKEPAEENAAASAAVLAKLSEDDDHDLSLIVERLSWTPEERLAANTSFARFYASIRPDGPLIPD